MFDQLGDRMKAYESANEPVLMRTLPILARVDGRAFHTLTRGLERPFDTKFHSCMMATAMALAEETQALSVYFQSDEISLLWYCPDYDAQPWFNYRHSKMVSMLAATATSAFTKACKEYLPELVVQEPKFDARVWQVPSIDEAANYFIWRENDAVRNSIQSVSQHVLGHAKCQNQNQVQLQDLLHEKGINWNDTPPHFKRGTYVQRRKVMRPYTVSEMEKLPAKHEARNNPALVVTRTDIVSVVLPPMTKLANKSAVLCKGEDPVLTVAVVPYNG